MADTDILSGSGPSGNYRPSFATGNDAWNSALGNIAGTLFPDPTRAAHSYYYGTAARKNLAETDRIIGQQNASIAALMQMQGLTNPAQLPAPPTYSPSNMPGFAPVMNAPANTPMAPPGQLATPPGYPGPNGPSATDLAHAVVPNAQAPLVSGNAPPASSPTNGAMPVPAAPNTTASNGQMPQNTPGDGMIHPGTIQPPGGGQKYAPPAMPNGAPAPVMPGLNLGTYVALQAAAGRNADEAKMQGLAYLTQAFQSGIIDHRTFSQLLSGLGNNAMYESDAATGRTVLNEQGATQREGMRLSQQERQFRATPQTPQGVDANGNPVILYPGAPGETQPVTGPRAFNQPLEEQRRTLVQTTDRTGGPGTYTQQGDAAGKQAYSADTQRLYETPVRVMEPGPDGKLRPSARAVTYRQAMDQGLTLSPESADQVKALATQAGLSGANVGRRYRSVTTAMQPPEPVDTKEGVTLSTHLDNVVARDYAPTKDLGINKSSAQLSPEAHHAVTTRATELLRDPESAAYKNPTLAVEQALQEMKQAGVLDEKANRNWQIDRLPLLQGNTYVRQQIERGRASDKFVIPSNKPYEPGAMGVAPKGMKDGQQVEDEDTGRRGVVRNGFIYAR